MDFRASRVSGHTDLYLISSPSLGIPSSRVASCGGFSPSSASCHEWGSVPHRLSVKNSSTGPEGPGSASRPRPHPRRRRRHRRSRCSRTPSRWPRCLRWGRCGRVRAGRLPVVARVLAVPAYVGARLRLHPASDACDLSGEPTWRPMVRESGLLCPQG